MPKAFEIQIIDDGMELCRELRVWLIEAGYAVACSQPERSLFAAVAARPPGLVIVGIRDATGPGYAFYERLRSHRQLRHLPVIVVSEDADLEYELLDAYDFQTRPFDRQRLLNALTRAKSTEPSRLFVHLSAEQLEPFKELLFKRSGLHFSASNQRLLERGLQRRMQALQLHTPKKYFDYLARAGENLDEFNKLVGLLTVGETCFFRYRSHHDALVRNVLPELIARNAASRRLRLWSAGCSTGEEPYSLAMKLVDNFPQLQGWDVQILATDINKRSLRHAREGIYRERSLRQVEPHYRERYFRRVGDLYAVESKARALVRFNYLNLQDDCYPELQGGTAGFDLILCRNVLIYFQVETIRQIVTRFADALNPQGYLFLGHAETLQYLSDRFSRHHQHGAFYYQRKMPVAERGVIVPEPAAPLATLPAAPSRPAAQPAPPAAPPPRPVVPAADPEELYRQAVLAFDREEFPAADQLFDQVLALRSGHPHALVGKGLICANRGEYDESRRWCARAIQQDDLCPAAYLLRGLILDMEEQLERALVEYQKVLWLDRDFIVAHYFSAKIYRRLGQIEQQGRALRNAVRLLEKQSGQEAIPFSGGMSRPVFLSVCRHELAALQ